MPDKKPSLTLMADTRGRWLWSHVLSSISLPDDTIFQANRWLEKYAYFCEHPDDNHLLSQFNPEGMNLARQVQLSLGSAVDVAYTDRHPNRKIKKGSDHQIIIETWHGLYAGEPCSRVDVHTPLSVMEFLMEKCEESGDIAEIEADHYQQFIKMDNEDMRALIRRVVFSMAAYINDSDQWKTEDALLDRLGSTLLMIMQGMMFFSEGGGEPVFAKPSHMPTNEEVEQLRTRADSERETIREVLWEVLHEQAAKKQGEA